MGRRESPCLWTMSDTVGINLAGNRMTGFIMMTIVEGKSGEYLSYGDCRTNDKNRWVDVLITSDSK